MSDDMPIEFYLEGSPEGQAALAAREAMVRADTLEEAGKLMDRNVKALSDGIDAAIASGVEFHDDEKFAATEAVAMLERIAVAIRALTSSTEGTN